MPRRPARTARISTRTRFPLLKKNYIDTGKVYYVFRVFPLQPSDGAAEAMARCLPEDKYFQFIDLLFRNQPKWDREYGVTDVHGGLVQMGRIAGMSADQVDKCIADKAKQDRINKVAQDGQTKYNITRHADLRHQRRRPHGGRCRRLCGPAEASRCPAGQEVRRIPERKAAHIH